MLSGNILRNRYKILKLMGSGGFGDTYQAEDLDLPSHPFCVVKHFRPKPPDPRVLPVARRLFEAEAQTLYRLGNEHSQIPRLFAHFEEQGEFYLVQEFIDGHDLSRELTPGRRWSEPEVIRLLQDVLEILAFIHRYNVIHRDIKPQNLMRRRKDNKLVLIDFGAVKEIGTLMVNTQGQTNATVAIGTPGYMPSEQASGHPKACSDLHALGVLAIQALTGTPPEDLPKDPQTLEIIWRDRAQVSPHLAAILDKMVRYHFSQRYQTATDVLNALTPPTQLTPPPSLLPPPPPPENPASTKGTRTAGLVAVGFGLALGVLFLAKLPDFFTSANAPNNPANSENLESPLPLSSPTAIASSPSPPPSPVAAAEDLYNQGWQKYDEGDYQGAIADFTKAIAIKPDYAVAYNDRGLARSQINDSQGAIADFTEAIKHKPDYSLALYNRGVIRAETGDNAAAIEDYTQAIRINGDWGSRSLATAYNNRGYAYYELSNHTAAVADLSEAIKLDPEYAKAFFNRGLAYAELGDRSAAATDFLKSAELYAEQEELAKAESALKAATDVLAGRSVSSY
ncbi:MAG: tetratricopeptide repeat protein [Synechococcales cyanobacterium C42_A2020_086]|jgi:serine/threonine protein kinase|nr:tetratricopeptide repeat protein [Synechococcales cyanobacterium C42_A2020_086]